MLNELWSDLRYRCRALFRRSVLEHDLEAELTYHVERETEKYLAQGMAPAQARRRARLAFGGVEQVTERVRDARGTRLLQDFVQDVRQGLRQLRREPGFAAVAVLTLGLAIAANATMFAVVDRLLLRPPVGVRDPTQVVRLYFRERMAFQPGQPVVVMSGTSYPMMEALRRSTSAFSGVAAHWTTQGTLGAGPGARRVAIAIVSGDYFRVVGTPAEIGRVLAPTDDGAPVIVLSDRFWRGAFGGERSVLGRAVRVEGRVATVVGVVAADFAGLGGDAPDVWGPARFLAPTSLVPGQGDPWSFAWRVVARLRPGAEPALAAAQATAAYRQEVRSSSGRVGRDTLGEVVPGSIVPARGPLGMPLGARVSLWLAGVAAVVLLIACANIASLLLARALRRRREMAMRLALGAGRGRVVRQLLAEALLLSTLAAAAALLLSLAGSRLVRAMLMPGIGVDGVRVDGRVLALTAVATLLATLLAGLAPALRAGRTDVEDALRGGERGGRRRSRLQGALLVAQAALSAVLLVGAGVFVLSLHRVRSRDVGIDRERVLLAQLPLRMNVVAPQVVAERYRAAVERVRRLPGVERATLAGGSTAGSSPGSILATTMDATLPGHAEPPSLPGGFLYASFVDPDYFATMGARVLRGRAFSEADGSAGTRVAIVNATMARYYWPHGNPIGQCLIVEGDRTCRTVVGVVQDVVALYLVGDARAGLYLPRADSIAAGPPSALLVRVADGARVGTVAAAERRELQSLAPDMPYVEVRSYADVFAPELTPWRLGATMFALFGTLALVIAAVGLFSVLAYTVAQRTHEVGVRVALGARAGDVVRLVVLDGVRVVLLGLAFGLLAALAAGRFLEPLLYATSPRDPKVLAAVAGTLLLAALAAAVVPALRAARLDPLEALKVE